ncbi:DUF2723 domain-containing protein [candidate division KSB1 bacterium]|nr:DUF2723 domain-containing protein [candidate division KSB1 bacterium]
MQNYKIINKIAAGLAFTVSFLVYLRTIAPTVSFWDCGEFITCSYILGIPHPPGAPFYLLLGRIFTLLPLASDIAWRVNLISSLSSGLTVMLTYLIIVRLIKQWRGEPKNGDDVLVLVASGLIGALAYAFTDTFWFNAVEAEVYAISMLFTSLIVWLILVWLEKADFSGSERYILIIAYLVGLAIGVHLLMILAIPAVALVVYYKYLDKTGQQVTIKNFLTFGIIIALAFAAVYPGVVQYIPWLANKVSLAAVLMLVIVLVVGIFLAVSSKQKIVSLALMCGLLVILGYSTYALIYIRSGLDPEIDENDPENITQMIKYLNREQYGTLSTLPRRFKGLPPDWQFEQEHPYESYSFYNFGEQMKFFWNYQFIKMYVRYFGWQFIGKGDTIGRDGFITEILSPKGLFLLPFIIGMLGAYHHFKRHHRHAFMVLSLFLLTGIAIIVYLNQEDPQPRERDYVYVGSFFAFAIWIGIGVNYVLEKIREKLPDNVPMVKLLSTVALIVLFFVGPGILLANNFKSHDRTGNYVAYDYSYNILQTCEKDAIVFTNGDNDTFPLWFLQYVYKVRPDVRVVNLSLLNTPWYIKQLKHQEPKVPISLSDDEIEKLEIRRWKKRTLKIPVNKRAYDEAFRDLGGSTELMQEPVADILSELTVDVEPTVFGQALRVQDLMILNILYANQWRKPVYFAVTVSDQNKVNLEPYLRMDGLGFELVPYNGQKIYAEKLEHNLFNVFQFRGLNDPNVFLNDNVVGLLQNYRAAFMRLAHEYMNTQEYDKMAKVLDKMEEAMPSDIIPVPDPRIHLQIGQLYSLAGRTDEFIKRAELAVKQFPDNTMSQSTLLMLYRREGMTDKVVELLEDWVKKNPDDKEAQQELEKERAKLLPGGPIDSASVDSAMDSDQ